MAPTAGTDAGTEAPAARRRAGLTARLGAATLVPAVAALVLAALVIGTGGWLTVVAAVVIALLVAGAVLALRTTRQLQQSIAELQRGAQRVATTTLPGAVNDVRAGRQISTKVEPVSVHAAGEVGELARAFDAVHAEARALAVEQAGARTGYGTSFVNLSRRSQALVQGQLRLIEQLERDEEDPDQLAALFRLDHLATRMRRTNENLAVLCGDEPQREPAQQPVALEELLRAAISEIEQYQRVTLQPPPDATVHGTASGDLVRLVAELLDNATAFSDEETPVTVSAVQDPDESLLVRIQDAGIGMGPADIARANEELAARHTDELPGTRQLGLFVVGRLAQRQGVHVALRAGDSGGLVAGVRLPRGLLAAVGAPDRGRGLDFATRARHGEDTAETVLPQPAQPYGASRSASAGSARPPRSPEPNRNGRQADAPGPARPSRRPEPNRNGRAGAARPPHGSPRPRSERTPIFDHMLSAWFVDPQAPVHGGEGAQAWVFTQAGARSPARDDRTAAPAEPEPEPEKQRWEFAADEGWQAVQQVAGSEPDRYTTAGLPVRTPRARLLPGSVPGGTGGAAGTGGEPQPEQGTAPRHRSADTVRSRLSSFQHGVRRGRDAGDERSQQDERPRQGTASPLTQPAGTVPEARRPGELHGGAPTPSTTTGSATSVAVDALTAAGLPQRTPRANLRPGSIPAGDEPVQRDPQDVRSRLSSFQHGLSRGRHSVGNPEQESDEHPYQEDE